MVTPHPSRVRRETDVVARLVFDAPLCIRREPTSVWQLAQSVQSMQSVLGVQHIDNSSLAAIVSKVNRHPSRRENPRDFNAARKSVRQLAGVYHELTVQHFQKQMNSVLDMNAAVTAFSGMSSWSNAMFCSAHPVRETSSITTQNKLKEAHGVG